MSSYGAGSPAAALWFWLGNGRRNSFGPSSNEVIEDAFASSLPSVTLTVHVQSHQHGRSKRASVQYLIVFDRVTGEHVQQNVATGHERRVLRVLAASHHHGAGGGVDVDIAHGTLVKMRGLTSGGGALLNGQYGHVLPMKGKLEGRVGVRLQSSGELRAIKLENLEVVPPGSDPRTFAASLKATPETRWYVDTDLGPVQYGAAVAALLERAWVGGKEDYTPFKRRSESYLLSVENPP